MRIPLLITIVHKNKMRLLFWQAHGLFVKIGTFPQTTYAGITRIRFKGTPQCADLSLSAPLFSCLFPSIVVQRQKSSPGGHIAPLRLIFFTKESCGGGDRA